LRIRDNTRRGSKHYERPHRFQKPVRSALGMVFLISLMTSVSCNPTNREVETETFSPTLTNSVQETLTPHQTNTLTPIPTVTLTTTSPTIPTPSQPSFTTPTIPQETMAALATLDSLVTQVPNLEEYYSWECILYPCYTSGLGLSPNGLWAAFFSARESGGLKIVSIDGTKQWEVYFSELSGIPCPCGDALVAIDHWSADGKYIYLYPYMGGDGGEDWLWRDHDQLIRLDLDSGNWIDTQMGAAYSFSPDDQFIAYRSESGINIYEINTGQEAVFPVLTRFIDFGQFIWSPDSSRIIYVASEEELDGEARETGLTVFLVDLKENSVETIFENDIRYLYPVVWPENNLIIFNTLYERQTYQLDLETYELISIYWP